jgi:hypothetical protein
VSFLLREALKPARVRGRHRAVALTSAICCAIAVTTVIAQSPQEHEVRVVRPHASKEVVRFAHSSGAYSLEHPADWKAHERGERTNIGAENGLIPTERGFRTVYGVIVQLTADPLAGTDGRSLERSAAAAIDAVLKRNPHQALKVPVHADGTLAGAPAVSAVLMGTSPVTKRGERVEIVSRYHGTSQLFTLLLVSPADDFPLLETPLRRLRESVRLQDK